MKTMARNGFTFVEILVVTVLGAVILLATLQILLNQQRTYTAQAVQIRGTQATRGALDVLSASRHLERIADLATNIAEDVIFMVQGDVVRHGLAAQQQPEKPRVSE